MKKIIAMILALVMTFSLCGTAFASTVSIPEGEFIRMKGDINGDRCVSNYDLVALARYIVGYEELDNVALYYSDMNGDGIVANADIIELAKAIVSISVEPDDGLTEEVKEKIIESIVRQSYEDYLTNPDRSIYAHMIAYFGTYSGCEAALFTKRGVSAAVVVNVEVNELVFSFSNPLISLYLYKDSQFKKIDEAYEAGWITAEDVQSIWAIGDGSFGMNSVSSEEISNELKIKMFSDFIKQNGFEDDFEELVESRKVHTTIEEYYGTFSGCEAVLADAGGGADVLVNVDVNGLRFTFSDTGNAIYIFKDSQALRIDEAYKAEWITDEDVAAIWEAYMNK